MKEALRIQPFLDLDQEHEVNRLVRRLNTSFDALQGLLADTTTSITQETTQIVREVLLSTPTVVSGGGGGGGGSNGAVLYSALEFNVPLSGTKDGANREFTNPFGEIAIGNSGRPMIIVQWKGGILFWTTSNPPPPRYFTLTGSGSLQKIITGDAPLANDKLELQMVALA